MLRSLMLTAVSVLLFGAVWTFAEPPPIETKYPIVLAHGLLGFDSIPGAVNYWHKIPETLRDRGLQVYVTRVSKLNSTQIRGEQLAEQVAEVLKTSGAKKVNIIGHSHGGLDARYVAAIHPDWVASVTTVGSPHQGALLADKLIDQKDILSIPASTLLNAFGKLMDILSGDSHHQDSMSSLGSLTTKSTQEFNRRFPAGLPHEYCGEGAYAYEGIRFYSWGGIKVRTRALDPTDYFFWLTSFADDRETDGLVERCSTHFGKVIRDDYRHNHLDLVNGMWGLIGTDEVSAIDIFLEHAQRLKDDGV